MADDDDNDDDDDDDDYDDDDDDDNNNDDVDDDNDGNYGDGSCRQEILFGLKKINRCALGSYFFA